MTDLPPPPGHASLPDGPGPPAPHQARTRPKVVLQAHATRSITALALLMHGRDRGARDLGHPLNTILGSLVVAVIMVIAVVVGGRVGTMINHT